MSDQFNPTSQHEVQRQLGRCLIRIQQYETLLKAMLSVHRMGGAAHELEALQAQNTQHFANKTLGTLVAALFETYVVSQPPQRPVMDETKLPPDKVSFSFSHHLQMDEERLVQVKTAIDELVTLRNDLVHHFVERFSLWTNEGCALALQHLHDAYERIDARYLELREWAQRMDQGRKLMAEFIQSAAYRDYIEDGIAPDGSVNWAWAGIVGALREALEQNAVDGWLRLDAAVEWMARHYPQQTPHRYTCRTWPQVLNDSGAFRLEYRQENYQENHQENHQEGKRKVPWFCARG